MHSPRLTFLAFAGAALTLCIAFSNPSLAATRNEEVSQLIEALGDRDPAIRERADARLAEIGPSAHASLEEAARSDDPERAQRAEQLLRKLPWSVPEDPPDVRRALAGYGLADAKAREQALKRLLEVRAFDPALRVLLREPSEPLRWWLVASLMETNSDELMTRVREWAGEMDDPARHGSPVVALAAWAWNKESPERSDSLYLEVIAIEAQQPTFDRTGLLQRIYDVMILKAMQGARYDAAADLLRKLIARGISPSTATSPVSQLFALHAYMGPLKHFDSDLVLYGPPVRRPRGTDLYSALAMQLGVTPPPRGAMSGHLLSDIDPMTRLNLASVLLRVQLPDAAAHELEALLGDADAGPAIEMPARYQLAHLAGNAGRDREAADHLDRILALERSTDLMMVKEIEVEAQASWRRLRAARAENKTDELRQALDRLVTLSPSHADIALDVVPLLKAQNRHAEADRFFDRAYRQLKLNAERSPDSAEAANNLAWLCARSEMHLEEALDLATRAITLSPNNPAYLDTAAEAHFAVGNIDKAIELETQALKTRPTDTFMLEQLARFKAAKKKAD